MVLGVTWRPCWVTLGFIRITLALIEVPWEPIEVTFTFFRVRKMVAFRTLWHRVEFVSALRGISSNLKSIHDLFGVLSTTSLSKENPHDNQF